MREITEKDLVLTSEESQLSREIEAVMKKAADTTTLIETSASEHGRSLAPDQTLFALWDVRQDATHKHVWVPGERSLGANRSRTLYKIPADDLLPGAQFVRAELI